MPEILADLLADVRLPDGPDPDEVQARMDGLTKPRGSLGRLEGLAVRLAHIQGDPPPPLRAPVVFVLAGDHGAADRGLSAYPREVTAQMCRNLAAGGAAINAIAGACGATVVVADFGVDADLSRVEGLAHRKVRAGSSDLVDGPAMDVDEAVTAILRGADLVRDRRPDVAALGEMGIGNTTAASAVTAALTGASAEVVVGPGTGVEGRRLRRKRESVRTATARLSGSKTPDPLRILTEVGGFEIAGLVGVALAGARAGIPVVSDGFIATAAAALAVRMAPSVRPYLFAGHRSPEPGHDLLLRELELEPILDLELRLGEGTGAALALPILHAAGAPLREMASFDEAGISGPASTKPRTDGVARGEGTP